MKSEHNLKDSLSRLLFALILLACATFANAQGVSPIGAIGSLQVFDNNGNECTACVLYTYVGGTTTQSATYTDYTGTVQNPDPTPFGSGARANIWLTTGAYYKLILCVQNDGASCAPSDVLFSEDQVIGGASGSSSGSSGTWTGTLISGSTSPASSGIVRLASGDSMCWRNAGGTANLCLSKDTNDILTWAGGSLKLPIVACSAVASGYDYLCANSGVGNRLGMSNNGGSYVQIAADGIDLNDIDEVTQLHFGNAAYPLTGGSNPPSTTNPLFCWNGTQVVGCAATEQVLGWGSYNFTSMPNGDVGCGTASFTPGLCAVTTFTYAHSAIRFTWYNIAVPSGCSTYPVLGIRDITSSTNLYTVTFQSQSLGYVDSGTISVSMTAGHVIGVGVLTGPAGCSVQPGMMSVQMVYQ